MQTAVQEGTKKIEKMLIIKNDQSFIGKRLHDMVDSCMEIDIRGKELNNESFKR